MNYLIYFLKINIVGILVYPNFQNNEMKNIYFTSPQQSVEIITELLKNENWEILKSYYYLENCSQGVIDSMLSGDYFIRKSKPEVAHPGGFWKYKHPFSPGFNYTSHEEIGGDIIKVNLMIEIDQGNGNIQQGISSYFLIKLKNGYQIQPL